MRLSIGSDSIHPHQLACQHSGRNAEGIDVGSIDSGSCSGINLGAKRDALSACSSRVCSRGGCGAWALTTDRLIAHPPVCRL